MTLRLDAKKLSGISQEADYGLTPDNPVRIGGGSKNELKYLHMLGGPEKEYVIIFLKSVQAGEKG